MDSDDSRSTTDDGRSESVEYGPDDDLSSDCGSAKIENKQKKKGRRDFLNLKTKDKVKVANRSEVIEEYSREENRRERVHFLTLDAYSRHKKMMNDYLRYYGGSISDFKRDPTKDKTDHDVLREHHKFLWEEDEEADSWEKRLARKYYDKLFKEYCIADLSLYKKNKIALRWRIEKEVISGRGQFVCGEKRCEETDGLRSWEVNFGYVEQGEKKNALVKLRLCPDCSYKLNYHHKKKDVTKKLNRKRKSSTEPESDNHKKRKQSGSDDDDDEHVVEGTSNGSNESSVEKPKTSTTEENVWSKERAVEKEKSKEEEFDEYFEDMFL